MQPKPDAERHLSEKEVRDEIAYFEARLSEMGMAGDCAYERALAGAFHAILEERKGLLSRMYGQPGRRHFGT